MCNTDERGEDTVAKKYDPYKLPADEDINYGYSDASGKSTGSRGLHQITSATNANKLSNKLQKSAKMDGVLDAKYIRDNMYGKFSRFGFLDPYNRMPTVKEVLFFTKPDLNILNESTGMLQSEISNVPFFIDLYSKYKNVIGELQSSYNTGRGPCMCLLHNRVKDTLDLPDISSNDIDIAANMYGNDYTYRGTSEPSDDQFSFNLEFEDTRRLEVYMLFRAYEEYERYKKLGRITPKLSYIENKILHDQITIYKFVLSDDFSTILHYSELWGCYPTGLPRSVFSSNDFSSGLSLSIPWKCAFVEDMNPLILSDFNVLMNKYVGGKVIPITADNGRINISQWATGAYVAEEHATSDPNSRMVYRLKWVE